VRGYTVVSAGSPLGIHPVLHPGRAARLLAADGRELGYLGEIHPALAPTLDLGDRRAYVAELDADLLISLSSADRQTQPISRFPVVKRDIAVVVPDAVDASSLVQAITVSGGDLLQEVRVFDVYHGEQVPAGYKSVACALTLQAADRTLDDREAGEVFARVAARLADTFGGQVRDT
jgi:phenylalanyl-tRNA synthetase beta chain